MLTEQKQEGLLRSFRMLISHFESELSIATHTLNEWNKARTISVSSLETTNNDQLTDKIKKLEKGKSELVEFVQGLEAQLKREDIKFDMIEESIQSSYRNYSIMFHEVSSLLNYKYTALEKNDINRRITAVNSSRMLNNDDMNSLQNQWSTITLMKNDERMALSKKIFESRLKEWENLVAQKRVF